MKSRTELLKMNLTPFYNIPKKSYLFIVAVIFLSITGFGSGPQVLALPSSLPVNCFSSPSSCGYPDASTVGVSNCSSLPSWVPSDLPAGSYTYTSGSQVNITASNIAISGYNIVGYFFYVESSGFTLDNDCLSFNGALWSGGQSSSVAVWGANSSASGLTVKNSTIEGANNTTESDETLITSGGGTNADIENNVLENAIEPINGVGAGSLIKNNYVLANGSQAGSHSEDIYESSATGITIENNTLLNPFDQSAVIFGDTASSGACVNQFVIENNMLAGGGWPITSCAHSTSVGTSTMDIENNRFARCLGTKTYDSSLGGYYCGSAAPGATGSSSGAGADNNGYWPEGGFFGLASDVYSGAGQVWSDNYWDNNLDLVNADGSEGAPVAQIASTSQGNGNSQQNSTNNQAQNPSLKAPDTGFKLVSAKAGLALIVSAISALALVLIGRHFRNVIRNTEKS